MCIPPLATTESHIKQTERRRGGKREETERKRDRKKERGKVKDRETDMYEKKTERDI